jgi:lipid-A-disaccharide synthase-like uncharacterized protein
MKSNLILILGLVGQGAFSMRFLIQWIQSEKEKKSVIPISFWYMSLIGSLLLLIYALIRMDPVFILGQSFGFIVYIRNIYLIKHAEKLKNIRPSIGD